jgi:hypothetical protein
VYFQEIEPGYYLVRLRPNVEGFWRCILTWGDGNQAVSFSYNVVNPEPDADDNGLNISFGF